MRDTIMHISELLQAENQFLPQIQRKGPRNEIEEILQQFVSQINLERAENRRLKPTTFMAVKMRLLAICRDKYALRDFYQECLRYKNRPQGNGSFSRCFYGATKTKKDQ